MIFNRSTLLATLLAAPLAFARVGERQFYNVDKDGTKRFLDRSCTRGNGYPFARPVFTLNLLGKFEKDNAEFSPQCSGKTCSMAILLDKSCKGKNGDNCKVAAKTQIKLTNGGTSVNRDAFDVVDADGTDGYAELMVPDPFKDTDSPCYGDTPNTDECTEAASYHIFARVRGKGKASIGLCFCDADVDLTTVPCPPDNEYCGTPGVIDARVSKKAADITSNLLTVCADVDGDGNTDGVGLFDDFTTADGGSVGDDSYFWEVKNEGVRNAELRFIPRADLDPECFKMDTKVTRGSCLQSA